MVTFKTWSLLPGAWEVHIHNNCQHNELIALQNRVCQATPDFQPAIYAVARKAARALARHLGKTPRLSGEWVEAYTGRKKTIYRNAQAQYELAGVEYKHQVLKSFVKLEKISDPTRDPRIIQARHPVYNYALANYLKPIEHRFYKIRGTKKLRKWLPDTQLVAKCQTLEQRAKMIVTKMSKFANPVCHSIDCSRFDAHVTKEQLALEHQVYKLCNSSKELQSLLDKQYKNIGYTKNGVKYCCPAGRCSGDVNTAMGNCIIMLIMIMTAIRVLRLDPQSVEIYVDGDDTLIMTDETNEHQLSAIVQIIQLFGHEVKLENRSTTVEGIVHCQAQPVQLQPGQWRMVQNPWRHLSRYLTSVRHLNGKEKTIRQYLYQLGTCSLACHSGVPIFHALAKRLLEAGKPGKFTMSGTAWQAARQLNAHTEIYDTVSITARQSFEAAFGIPVHVQLAYEHYLSVLDL